MSNFPQQNAPSPYGVQPQQIAPQPNSNSKVVIIVLAVLGVSFLFCAGLLAALLIPAIGAARTAAQRMQRSNNIKQIAIGLHNYHSAYKQLPYTNVTDVNNQELCSWRMGISPFIEAQAQWETIINDYGPDSKSRVANDAPIPFQVINGPPGETNVFAIVANNSMFPPTPNTKVGFRDVLDGLANTAMAIELPNRSTNWTSSENMTPDEAYQAVSELEDPEVAHLLMGDGAVVAVASSIDRDLFMALCTRDGSESIDDAALLGY